MRLAGLLLVSLLPGAAGGLATTSSQDADRWFTAARAEIERRVSSLGRHNTNRAKNVILFIADGNGISTNVATRLWAGQNARPPFARDRPVRWATGCD